MVTVTVAKRARKLQTLLNIRLGPGAAILPPDVKRIHLSFAYKINDGHMGARKIWRNCLPRLKYHNPAVSMTVERSEDQSGPSALTIFYATQSSAAAMAASPAASPAPTSSTSGAIPTSDHVPFDKTETIDMKGKHEREILGSLLEMTRAKRVEATEEESAELARLEDQERRSGTDRERTARVIEAEKREKMLLEQARGTM